MLLLRFAKEAQKLLDISISAGKHNNTIQQRQKSISRKTNPMTLRINNQNYGGKVYFQCTIIRR